MTLTLIDFVDNLQLIYNRKDFEWQQQTFKNYSKKHNTDIKHNPHKIGAIYRRNTTRYNELYPQKEYIVPNYSIPDIKNVYMDTSDGTKKNIPTDLFIRCNSDDFEEYRGKVWARVQMLHIIGSVQQTWSNKLFPLVFICAAIGSAVYSRRIQRLNELIQQERTNLFWEQKHAFKKVEIEPGVFKTEYQGSKRFRQLNEKKSMIPRGTLYISNTLRIIDISMGDNYAYMSNLLPNDIMQLIMGFAGKSVEVYIEVKHDHTWIRAGKIINGGSNSELVYVPTLISLYDLKNAANRIIENDKDKRVVSYCIFCGHLISTSISINQNIGPKCLSETMGSRGETGMGFYDRVVHELQTKTSLFVK